VLRPLSLVTGGTLIPSRGWYQEHMVEKALGAGFAHQPSAMPQRRCRAYPPSPGSQSDHLLPDKG
jgi:hypothetical protein